MSKAEIGINVVVVAREVVGMGDRPSLIYECACGVKGTQGQLVRHLHEDSGFPYTEISRALGVARYAWGKAEREREREQQAGANTRFAPGTSEAKGKVW